MSELTTRYLGLELRNPLIAASSGLTARAEGVERAVDAGVGAVVLKSLYEEQLREEGAELQDSLYDGAHPEAQAYADADLSLTYGTRTMVELIEKTRDLSVPIIASISCLSGKWWPQYAGEAQAAGAHALELNLSMGAIFAGAEPAELAAHYRRILASVVERVEIPVALKLGPHGVSERLIMDLLDDGATGIVLFHRPLRPRIDIENLELRYDLLPSHPVELGRPLRWIGNLAGKVPGSLCGNTGLHSVEGLVSLLLAGADAVQAASVFYLKGLGFVKELLTGLEDWMERHDYDKVEDFVGLLSEERAPRPEAYERTQYLRSYLGHD